MLEKKVADLEKQLQSLEKQLQSQQLEIMSRLYRYKQKEMKKFKLPHHRGENRSYE